MAEVEQIQDASVSALHPEYSANTTRWRQMRDHLAGSETVKKRGVEYLPFLGDENDSDDQANYQRYKQRALYLEATARTHQVLTGAITWKDPIISDMGDNLVDLLQDVTMEGESFAQLTRAVVSEVVAVSRCGILVDLPAIQTPTYNNGEYPYFVLYKTEDIINWRYERINNEMKLTLVVLREMFSTEGTDEFTTDENVRYRVLRLRDGVYTQQVYEQIEEGGQILTGEEFVPAVRGAGLNEIPFVFCGVEGVSPRVPKLVLDGVKETNISHYVTSADLEHGRHFTALPQPWVAGFQPDQELRIGSGVAWVATEPNARAGYLEFSGSGLGSLERALEHKEKQMAILGAKLLEGQRPGVLAAETARINQAGESSTLSAISSNIEIGLTKALRLWVNMQAGTDVPFVELNKDFVDQRLDPAGLSSVVQAYLSGAISYSTLFYNLKRGEIVADTVDETEEEAAVKEREEQMMQELGSSEFGNASDQNAA